MESDDISVSKKTYEVCGSVPYAGVKPGETFTASLDANVERRAIARGSIRVVKSNGKEKTDA